MPPYGSIGCNNPEEWTRRRDDWLVSAPVREINASIIVNKSIAPKKCKYRIKDRTPATSDICRQVSFVIVCSLNLRIALDNSNFCPLTINSVNFSKKQAEV
jgi:hypothetical protein